ncbi:MAG: hypothetical protein J6K63_08575 [Clostridia bacterium]|nr:hypothetical protein [Clostridia bacterium]
MNNREIFEVVEIEVIAFDAEDIIRTSIGTGIGSDTPGNFGTNQASEEWSLEALLNR